MRTELHGLNGSNPLGFMASVGLLRVLDGRLRQVPRLGFRDDGSFVPWIEHEDGIDLAEEVVADAAENAGSQPWRLEYEKTEKRGTKLVADLKAPPEEFVRFLEASLDAWRRGETEGALYAAAYATDVAVDGKGNTKPTAFHFTAANQQFLGAVERIRDMVTLEWVERALRGPGETRPGGNLRWDPDAERSRALMGTNPVDGGTVVNAPNEWLAFRALPAFPCMPVGRRVVTTGVTGRRQDELAFHWPLWSRPASYATVRSLLPLAARWLDGALPRDVFAICSSEIRRTAQGFGNFGPARVRS